MKLVRFGAQGAEKPGLVDADGQIRDLSQVIDDVNGAALAPAGLAKLAKLDPRSLPLAPKGVRLGACVGGVGKLVGIGLNYSDHAAEVGKPLPPEPQFFLKATSSIVGPTDDLVLPRDSAKNDWEAELGIVIGRTARDVAEADALSHVAGYCTAGDFSERGLQALYGPTAAKSFDTFGPLGPYLVTADTVANPQALKVTTKVDGDLMQNGTTSQLIFGLAKCISYVSRFFTLHPGDVIITGTPAGVGSGRRPQVWLKPGQTVRLEVEGLGEQVHKVV